MYKNKSTGFYEEDFRWKGIPRLHVSYGEKTAAKARPLSDVMHRIFREGRTDLIAKVRSGEISPAQLAALVADEKPLKDAGVAFAEPWPTVRAAADKYVAWLLENEKKSDKTAAAAKAQLDHFVAFVGAETLLDQVTASRVTAFQRHLYSLGRAQNTVHAAVWRVSGLYAWCVRREQREAVEAGRAARPLHIPIDHDEITTEKTQRQRCLSAEEAERLVAATPPMLLFPVLAGLLAGLRIDEMLHLRPGFDIDLERGLLAIQKQPTWQPKNGKGRFVPIVAQLRPVIEYHLAHFASDDWMVPLMTMPERPMDRATMARHFRTIVRNAELVSGVKDPQGVVFHTLRHTFASWLVMKGADLYTVSQLLGNSIAMVESTYAHLAPDFKQRQVERLNGIVAIPDLAELPAPEVADAGAPGSTVLPEAGSGTSEAAPIGTAKSLEAGFQESRAEP